VHVFDEITKQLPDGVYLTGITQNGARLKFEGVAQSSTRVSAFMRNIDGSSYLKDPELEVVETKKNNVTGATFVLFAQQAGGAAPEDTAKQGKSKQRVAATKDKK
jgi:type IV pilus assembly protein PilN